MDSITRKDRFDPEFTYLNIRYGSHLDLSRQGVYLKFEQGPSFEREIMYGAWFGVNRYGSIQSAVAEARRMRNLYGPQYLGSRFLNCGARPRSQYFSLNESGTIGVHHYESMEREYCAWVATWQQKIPGMPQKRGASKHFPYRDGDLRDSVSALKEAIAYRKRMIDENYKPITSIWRDVMSPAEFRKAVAIVGKN